MRWGFAIGVGMIAPVVGRTAARGRSTSVTADGPDRPARGAANVLALRPPAWCLLAIRIRRRPCSARGGTGRPVGATAPGDLGSATALEPQPPLRAPAAPIARSAWPSASGTDWLRRYSIRTRSAQDEADCAIQPPPDGVRSHTPTTKRAAARSPSPIIGWEPRDPGPLPGPDTPRNGLRPDGQTMFEELERANGDG